MFQSGELLFRTAESSVFEVSKGDFAKNILILTLSEVNHVENQAFLSKVLSAAKLDLLSDTCFADISSEQPVNCFVGLAARPKFILVFGLAPKQVGFLASPKMYEPIKMNQCTWLFADALSVLEPDRDKKGQLWAALKAMFL